MTKNPTEMKFYECSSNNEAFVKVVKSMDYPFSYCEVIKAVRVNQRIS